MVKKKLPAISLLIYILLMYACEGGTMREETGSLKQSEDIQESLRKVSQQRIYFGHQSVGYNILEGLRDIAKENPQSILNIVETNDPAILKEQRVFAHAAVGHNTDPASKLNDFSKFLEQGIGNKVDIAFLKFCYVDITEETDVRKLFNSYRETHAFLKRRHPSTTFVHFTVPLTSNQSDIKTMAKNVIKKILGRPVRSYKDNIRRNQFNDMLRKEYEGREPLFDVAMIESTLPDGKKVINSENGITFYSLAPEYTDDGGHLNKKGRRIVAQQLLHFLAGLPAQHNK